MYKPGADLSASAKFPPVARVLKRWDVFQTGYDLASGGAAA
jgi:hypothetical protein